MIIRDVAFDPGIAQEKRLQVRKSFCGSPGYSRDPSQIYISDLRCLSNMQLTW